VPDSNVDQQHLCDARALCLLMLAVNSQFEVRLLKVGESEAVGQIESAASENQD